MTNSEQQLEIGNRIKERRLIAGKSQTWLARESGVPRRAIVYIERGERRIDILEFQAIALALRVTVQYLLTGNY
jgi:transcriptional regulator with XRE-family HTH domain